MPQHTKILIKTAMQHQRRDIKYIVVEQFAKNPGLRIRTYHVILIPMIQPCCSTKNDLPSFAGLMQHIPLALHNCMLDFLQIHIQKHLVEPEVTVQCFGRNDDHKILL